MKINTKYLILAAGAVALTLVAVDPAMAAGVVFKTDNNKSLGTLAQNVTTSLQNVSSLVTMLCYLCALIFGFIGALKWKAYGEQPDRTPFKIPVLYWGIAVMLAAFPEFMGTGISTLWGNGTIDTVVEQ